MGSGVPENSQVTAGRGITCIALYKAPTTFRGDVKDNCRYLSLNQIFPLGINVIGTGKISGHTFGNSTFSLLNFVAGQAKANHRNLWGILGFCVTRANAVVVAFWVPIDYYYKHQCSRVSDRSFGNVDLGRRWWPKMRISSTAFSASASVFTWIGFSCLSPIYCRD